MQKAKLNTVNIGKSDSFRGGGWSMCVHMLEVRSQRSCSQSWDWLGRNWESLGFSVSNRNEKMRVWRMVKSI